MSSISTCGIGQLLAVLHDRFARAVQTLRVAIALRFAQVVDHVDDDFFRRFEAERRRVADVQLDDAVAFFFEPRRFLQDRTANVVADVCELARLRDRPQRRRRQRRHPAQVFIALHVGRLSEESSGIVAKNRGAMSSLQPRRVIRSTNGRRYQVSPNGLSSTSNDQPSDPGGQPARSFRQWRTASRSSRRACPGTRRASTARSCASLSAVKSATSHTKADNQAVPSSVRRAGPHLAQVPRRDSPLRETVGQWRCPCRGRLR